jgi:H+/gluconate symporter-like permease
MKQNLTLPITSLLAILFMTLHLTSDVLRARAGTPEAGGSTLIAVPILVVWLYGTLVLAGRRSGHVIMLVGSLLAVVVPVVHVMPAGGVFHGVLAKSNGDFVFVWTLHALALTGMFSLVLAVRGLWNLRNEKRQNPHA